MERDEFRKPRLELIPLEGTVVHTPTSKSYDELMRVCECGGWKWIDGNLPTEIDQPWGYDYLPGEVCVRGENEIRYGRKSFYLGQNLGVITIQDFYERQGITPEMRRAVNGWFSVVQAEAA